MRPYLTVTAFLLLRNFMLYGYIPVETTVDSIHHAPDQPSVGTGVPVTVVMDVKMYHFVDYGIFYHIFRQIADCAYRQQEVIISFLAEKASFYRVGQ